MILASRRGFITGLAALVAAPAIVRASSLMPVRGIVMAPYRFRYTEPFVHVDHHSVLILHPSQMAAFGDEARRIPNIEVFESQLIEINGVAVDWDFGDPVELDC